MFYITNTVSGSKELFTAESKKIKMYVCGITPYDHAHVGHGRCYVAFDLLYRYLKFLDYEIVYCRNFTDVDDKLLNKAQKEFGHRTKYKQLADKFIAQYHKDMQALNCIAPTYEPRVTEHITEIILFIRKLIDKGHAYQSNCDVYFSVKSFSEYAKLSKHNLDDLRSGERVQVNELKKDPLDFALWKNEKEGGFWNSPWGNGRPGWHIECSALAQKYLQGTIDIHGGGLDLVFPHHENEIAQSECFLDDTFARYWIHNGLVQSNKEKMSKSIGNVFILHELFEQFDPMVIRYYFLTHHYRSPIDFSIESIESAQKAYKKLCAAFSEAQTISYEEIKNDYFGKQLLSYLSDDLNTPGMLGVVFQHLHEMKNNDRLSQITKTVLGDIFGLSLQPIKEEEIAITPEIQKLINERKNARVQKNWQRADEIRDKLIEMGVVLQDKKTT